MSLLSRNIPRILPRIHSLALSGPGRGKITGQHAGRILTAALPRLYSAQVGFMVSGQPTTPYWFTVSLWHKVAWATICLEVCCYGIDLGASIVRLNQSEHSISTDLDQWEWSSLMQKQRSSFNSQTKQNQLKLVQRWCWPSQAGGQRAEHLNQYKRLKWRLKIRMMKNILFSIGTLK